MTRRQRLAALKRVVHVAPRVVDERAGRAIRGFGLCVLLVERLARRLRPRTADAAAHFRGELVEKAAADAAGPGRVADRRESDDADAVQIAALLRRLGDGEVRVL